MSFERRGNQSDKERRDTTPVLRAALRRAAAGIVFLAVALTPAAAQRTSDVAVATNDNAPAFETKIIDFENVPGAEQSSDNPLGSLLQRAVPVPLSDQYEQSHGVVFEPGASVFLCQNRVRRATACRLPRAASGLSAALFDPRGRRDLTLRFEQPVFGAAMTFTAPEGPASGPNSTSFDGGYEYTVLLRSFDANGEQLSERYQDFYWRGENGPHWEEEFFIGAGRTQRAVVSRVTVRVWASIDQRETPTRFLFDDVKIFAPPSTTPPVYEDLERAVYEPRLVDYEPARFRRRTPPNEKYDYYPQAPRYRSPIDWNAAFAARSRQQASALKPPTVRDRRTADKLRLPILLPSAPDANSLRLFGRDDSFDASYKIDGADYSIEGTRILTDYRKAPPSHERGRRQPNLKFTEHSYGLSATFSLYGAAYAVHRYCRGDSPVFDRDCLDQGALREHLKTLVVAVGAAGEARP
ncbi:MAG: hypothetical protein AAGJ87_04110 [Pseudomonadota bacterium]